jgi:hypothetical protein
MSLSEWHWSQWNSGSSVNQFGFLLLLTMKVEYTPDCWSNKGILDKPTPVNSTT